MWAAHEGQADCVAALLAGGAHVDTAGDSRETPLAIAARRGHEDCVAALLERRANHPCDPVRLAALAGQAGCLAALAAAGGDVNSNCTRGLSALYLAASHGMPIARPSSWWQAQRPTQRGTA